MERYLVMATSRFVLWGALASLTAGCFDVHTVDPRSWLIDDFKNRDGDPTDPSFERWACRPVDENHQIDNTDCNTTAIDHHDSVLHLGATLSPGDKDFKRAELITSATLNHDLRPYARFWFSWKLEWGDQALSANALLKVQLTCTSFRDLDGAVSDNPCVVKTVSPNFGWNGPIPLELSTFDPPDDHSPRTNPQDCLTLVDGIKITVQSDATDQSAGPGRFDLYVDDITLEPRH
jgi:hypothetical protein